MNKLTVLLVIAVVLFTCKKNNMEPGESTNESALTTGVDTKRYIVEKNFDSTGYVDISSSLITLNDFPLISLYGKNIDGRWIEVTPWVIEGRIYASNLPSMANNPAKLVIIK